MKTTFNFEETVYDPCTILQYKLDDANAQIKKLRNEKKSLADKAKRKESSSTYWRGKYEDRCRRIEYLEKHCNHLQNIVDNGYIQNDTFDKDKSGIYRIYNVTTGESYVGQSSVNVRGRCNSHFKLCNDINDWHYDLTHNPDNYKYEIIAEGVPNQGTLDRLEIYYIGKYDCIENGYNKTIQAKFRFLSNYVYK